MIMSRLACHTRNMKLELCQILAEELAENIHLELWQLIYFTQKHNISCGHSGSTPRLQCHTRPVDFQSHY